MIPFCVKCNKNIYISTAFCPFCVNMLKLAQEPSIFEFIPLMTYTITNKNTGKKKRKYIVKESRTDYSNSFNLERPVIRKVEIDRRNNRYFEEVFDAQRNDTIHLCDEPLDEHFGHGSAKFKKK